MSAAERRRNILDAAAKVIGRSNYYEATTAKIAAEAGITEPTIYLHFPSKKKLFLELLDEIRELLISTFNDLVSKDTDPLENLKKVVKAHYEFVIRHGELHRVVSMAALVNDPDVRKKLALLYRDLRQFFIDRLEEARAAGILRREIDPEAVSLIMVSWIQIVGTLRIVGEENTITRDNFEKILEMIEQGLRRK